MKIGKRKIDCLCLPLDISQLREFDFTHQGKASHIKGKLFSIFLTILKLKHTYTVHTLSHSFTS